jgi:hypothetical protein
MKTFMKTLTRNFLAIPFTIVLLTPFTAQCYYNPSTGRWLSRDPVGEKGGTSLYEMRANDLLNGVDYLGLVAQPNGGPWGPPVYPLGWCNCTCRSVFVEYEPGGATMALGWYRDKNFNEVFGSKVHVKWDVDGNPAKCQYRQEEGETVTVVTRTDVLSQPQFGPGKDDFVPQIYTDAMHVGPFGMRQSAYNVKVYWSVTFRCRSSSGETIVRYDQFNLEADIQLPHSLVP